MTKSMFTNQLYHVTLLQIDSSTSSKLFFLKVHLEQSLVGLTTQRVAVKQTIIGPVLLQKLTWQSE